MSGQQSLPRGWWLALAAAALLLVPFVLVFAAGFLWLWQHGWLFWWLSGAAVISALTWGAGVYLRRPAPAPVPGDEPALSGADPTWSARELAAWAEVQALSAAVEPATVTERRRLLSAAQQTLEAVAAHYHPDHAEPLWEFTVPEMLLLTERVSVRVRGLLLEHVPMSHRVRVGQLMRAWGYGPTLTAGYRQGRRAYDVFRVVRAVNPLNALIAEMRDRFVHELSDVLQDYLLRRVGRIWVEEVGRAAIELYSGRLRLDAAALASAAEGEGLAGAAEPAALPGALRILVAGQTKAGKSTLVNALVGEVAAGVDVLPLTAAFSGYELHREGAPEAVIIDTPGIEDEAAIEEVVLRAFRADLILWVIPAHRADRGFDRTALDAVRARFAAEAGRKMPPLVVVASHVDRLTPAREWAPPYDLLTPSRPKEHAMRGALAAIADDLDVAPECVLPVRLDGESPWNLDRLWRVLGEQFDAAKRARWVRVLRTGAADDWKEPWRQLGRAGRSLGELLRK